jgi:galactokinase
MDQYASVMGQPDKAILLDCRDVTHEMIPLDLGPFNLLLLNSNVSHSLASSEYNTRRSECEQGVDILQNTGLNVESLRDVSPEELLAHSDSFPPVILRRCLYVTQENKRVQKAAHALKNSDLEHFGELMFASHEGLRKDYEVSCKELDFLVDFSIEATGVIGSRMMGGGFGGCTINLVHKESKDRFVEEIKKAYAQEFDLKLDPIWVQPSSGTSVIG